MTQQAESHGYTVSFSMRRLNSFALSKLLRKALKLAGDESDEMIITLSRKGFMFNETFSAIEHTVEHNGSEQIQTPINSTLTKCSKKLANQPLDTVK
jgi:DNA-binding winged helix-turn-helix (wHTH) protein